jgi:hypothetical protein
MERPGTDSQGHRRAYSAAEGPSVGVPVQGIAFVEPDPEEGVFFAEEVAFEGWTPEQIEAARRGEIPLTYRERLALAARDA